MSDEAKTQNLTELRAVGTAVAEGVEAVSDGLQMQDAGAGIKFGQALISAADDIKVDKISALEEIGAQCLRRAAELRRAELGITGVE